MGHCQGLSWLFSSKGARSCLCNCASPSVRGRAGSLHFTHKQRPAWTPPDTPLSAVHLTPLHRVNGKTLENRTRLYTVIPHRPWFWYLRIPLLPRRISSKSAPTAPWWPCTGVQGATHSNRPTHIPRGPGKVTPCLLWAQAAHVSFSLSTRRHQPPHLPGEQEVTAR